MTTAQSLRVIRRLIVIDLSTAMIYRIEFVLFMVSAIVGPVISLLIWRAALANGASLPVDAEYLTTYFVLLGVVSMLTSSWSSGFLAESIRLGQLSIWIARPGSTHLNGIANNISEKLIKAVALAPMIAVIWWLVRDTVDVTATWWEWAFFAVSILGAVVTVFAMDVMVGALAFWIDDIGGIDYARGILSVILRGQLVPLALMPAWAQEFVAIQPFRFTLSFSLELIVGDLSRAELATGMILQLVYPALFVVAARWLWRRGIRAYSAVGA